jgi:hypothetical protein
VVQGYKCTGVVQWYTGTGVVLVCKDTVLEQWYRGNAWYRSSTGVKRCNSTREIQV